METPGGMRVLTHLGLSENRVSPNLMGHHFHYLNASLWVTTGFPTHRRPYGFRSFSSTKMLFSLQRNVIFSHVDVKNRVLKISKTTSFFDISSCFFGMQHFFSFFSEALHCFDGLAKFFEKPVRCQWSQRFSPTVTQDKLFQFRVFFCVGSMIQPSWKAFGNIIFQAFPPSVSDLRPCHSGQEKKGRVCASAREHNNNVA